MRSEDTINTIRSINFNIYSALIDINTIVVSNQTKISKWWLCLARKLEFITNDCVDFFINRLSIGIYSQVIYLPKEKYLLSFLCDLIDAAIMNDSFEIKFFGTKNLIDMAFVNLTTFRVTLKTLENRKNV